MTPRAVAQAVVRSIELRRLRARRCRERSRSRRRTPRTASRHAKARDGATDRRCDPLAASP
eukprot:1379568-Prymnesium_polylepis.1